MERYQVFFVLTIIFSTISFGFAQEEVEDSKEITFDSNENHISVANFDSSQSEVENGFSEEFFNTTTSDALPLETEIVPGSVESHTEHTNSDENEEGSTMELFEDNATTENEEETMQPDTESGVSIDVPEKVNSSLNLRRYDGYQHFLA